MQYSVLKLSQILGAFLMLSLLLTSCDFVPVVSHLHKKSTDNASAKEDKEEEIQDGVKKVDLPNGLKMEVTYKDGKKNGVARYFFKNGKVYKESYYHDGKLHGIAKMFDRKGNVLRSTNYKNGKKHGDLIKYFKSGNPKLKLKYHENWPVPGIYRKAVTGEEIPEPKIIMERRPHPEGHPYRFSVAFALSENFDEVSYYALPDSVSWTELAGNSKNQMRYQLNTTAPNKASLNHYLEKNHFLMNEFDAYAVFELKGGYQVCVKQPVKYSFQN